MKALALVLLLVAGCSAQSAAEHQGGSVAEAEVWTLSLLSSGGITGRGAGNVHVNSAGTVTAGNLRSRDAVTKLSETELQRWDAAVRSARDVSWDSPPNDARGADMIEYEMKLDLGDEVRRIEWREDVTQLLPKELGTLFELAAEARSRALTPAK